MKRVNILISLATASLLLGGCGGGGGDSASTPSSPTNVPTGSYNVTVVDDNVVGATVSAPECATFTTNGAGSYTLKECIAAPSTIVAVGGFVDIDGDGVQDSDEASQTAPLKLKVSQTSLTNGFTVTPLTTLASQEDSNLSGLASKLGISEADLFRDVESNRNLQRSVNAILIAAREAGITKYDSFVKELKEQIKSASGNGTTALTGARSHMATNVNAYKGTYGVVFGGFISDTTGIDLSAGSTALTTAKGTIVPAGKVRLGGFIYDGIIANATITIYDGTTELASTTSDGNGRYSLEIDETLLSQGKVLKLVAILNTTKLISYITTDEIKAGLIGKKLSSGTVEDLVISNVTTAKAVLVQKTAPEALTNSKKMTEAKAVVEAVYASELLIVSAAIKDVVDNSKTITQSDTLALAQAIVSVDTTTKEVITTVPSNVTVNSTTISNVTSDPQLNVQLTTTKVIDKESLRGLVEGKTLYDLDYHSEYNEHFTYSQFHINTDGSGYSSSYKSDGTNWVVSGSNSWSNDTIKWSSDGSTLYALDRLPEKQTLISKETISIGGQPINIYIARQEVTGEPTENFYTDFIADSAANGTINFSSMSDSSVSDKNMTINYEHDSMTYTLSSSGTYRVSHNPNVTYRYRTLVKNGKTYIFIDDDSTSWGGGEVFYLDFANHKVYRGDSYHNIGFVDYEYQYDGDAIVNIWKNLTTAQKSQLNSMLSNAYSQQSLSSSNTQYQVAQKVMYQFIKSLAN